MRAQHRSGFHGRRHVAWTTSSIPRVSHGTVRAVRGRTRRRGDGGDSPSLRQPEGARDDGRLRRERARLLLDLREEVRDRVVELRVLAAQEAVGWEVELDVGVDAVTLDEPR